MPVIQVICDVCETDFKRNDEIINQGYILHRFWEHDIIHNMEIINACL